MTFRRPPHSGQPKREQANPRPCSATLVLWTPCRRRFSLRCPDGWSSSATCPTRSSPRAWSGHGAAIDPPREVLTAVAPVGGTLLKLMPHAYVVLTEAKVGVLVHLGLDTVALNGQGFTTHLQQGDQVSAGQPVITYDVPAIVAKGLNPIVPVVVMDEREAANIVADRRTGRPHRRGGRVVRGPPLMEVIITGGPGRDRCARRRRDRRAAGPQTRCGAGTGHRVVPAGDLRRTGEPACGRADLVRRGPRVHPRRVRRAARRPSRALPQRHRRGIRLPGGLRRRRGGRPGRARPPTSRRPARPTRTPSARPAASICRSWASAPTGTSGSTSPGPRWPRAPASKP